MEESGIHEISGLGMSHSRGEVVEAKSGALEKGSTEEIGDLRLRVAIELGPHFQEISEIHESFGNFSPERTGEIFETALCQRPLMRSLLVDEVHFEDEEGMIGNSTDVEEGPIPKSDTMPHPGADLVTEIGKGKCAMTEIGNVISRPIGGKRIFEGSERNAKEMIISEGNKLFVQTLEIRQVVRRPSHLALLR